MPFLLIATISTNWFGEKVLRYIFKSLNHKAYTRKKSVLIETKQILLNLKFKSENRFFATFLCSYIFLIKYISKIQNKWLVRFRNFSILFNFFLHYLKDIYILCGWSDFQLWGCIEFLKKCFFFQFLTKIILLLGKLCCSSFLTTNVTLFLRKKNYLFCWF